MLGHIDTVTVVVHGDGTVGRDADFNGSDEFFIKCAGLDHANHMVTTVHNALVKQLVEPGDVLDLLQLNFFGFLIPNPHIRIHILDRTDVGIRIVQDMLTIGLALVLLREVCHDYNRVK